MNMMSVLLGATGLLLVAAFVLSFGSLKEGMGGDATKKEIAELRSEIATLRQQEDALLALRDGNSQTPSTPSATEYAPESTNTTTAEEDALLAAENDALKDQIASLEEQVVNSEKKADVYRDEAGLVGQKMLESHNIDQRRARLIREALLIATVTEWTADDGFAVLSIQRADAAQEGTILGIRRKNGVVGKVRISQIYEAGQATAEPHLFPNGVIDIQAGDELIVPPL